MKFEADLGQFRLRYRQSSLVNSPHVVKLSGGRSSAYMLAHLLKTNLLSKERGDVVIFNNTAAEHPETYQFVKKLKYLTEKEFGIPFFMIEFATYEDISFGNRVRFSTFRIVNEMPRNSDNQNGYHYKGEVFEELLSHTAFLPNRHRRVCTSAMKIKVSEVFLSSWFACEDELAHLGHYGETSRMTDEGICTAHAKNGGKTPGAILLNKRKFVRNRPVSRPNQKFQDFTTVDLSDRQIISMQDATFGGEVDLRNRDFPVSFVSLVGLRADEPARLKKLNARICGSEDGEDSKPSSERVYTPLADNGYTKKDVSSFWSSQSWDLGLNSDSNLSNCMFCFLKGSKVLQQIASDLAYTSLSNEFAETPMDVAWWERLEREYGRDLILEERKKTNQESDVSFIGFFGENAKFSYNYLKLCANKSLPREALLEDESEILACNCTD